MLIFIYNKRISFNTLIWQFFHLEKIKSLPCYDGEIVRKQILSYIDDGSVNCPMEDDLAIPIRIIKGITFNLVMPLIGIYPMCRQINIYLCTDVKGSPIYIGKWKKTRGKTGYMGILSCIKYIWKTHKSWIWGKELNGWRP